MTENDSTGPIPIEPCRSDGTIDTRTDPDELGDLVAPWDRFMEGEPDAFFDLSHEDQVHARLEFPLLCPE